MWGRERVEDIAGPRADFGGGALSAPVGVAMASAGIAEEGREPGITAEGCAEMSVRWVSHRGIDSSGTGGGDEGGEGSQWS